MSEKTAMQLIVDRIEKIEKRMDDYNEAVKLWRKEHKELHAAINLKLLMK